MIAEWRPGPIARGAFIALRTQGDGPFVLTKKANHGTIQWVMAMARKAREKSEANLYHVMLRGVNRQQIFLDEEDNRHFLKVLRQCREISGFRLLAYCLMGNHVHLLLQTGAEPLEQVMKRIGTRYALWYNSKYERVGHLFQDRYRSEAVKDEAYFLTALRYILNNPVKAGICAKATDYPLSSAGDYLTGSGVTDTAFAEALLGRDALLEYLRAPSEEACMDDAPAGMGDRTALKALCRITETEDVEAAKRAVAEQPGKFIPALRAAGLSIRRISRLTGVPFGIVRKY